MSSSSLSTCPSCQQSNSAEMAFCIFCGASMTPAPKSASAPGPESASAPVPAPKAESAAGPAAGIKKCVACGKADSLNSQYCIFCGAAINANRSTSSAHMQTELSNLRTDIASVNGDGSKRKLYIPGALILVVWIGLGLAAGTGGALLFRSKEPKMIVSLPERGLAVLTAKPFSDVFVTYPDKRHFLMGRTGAKGDLAEDDLPPGDYIVEASSSDGLRDTAMAHVKQDSAGIVGGPPGPKLLSAFKDHN